MPSNRKFDPQCGHSATSISQTLALSQFSQSVLKNAKTRAAQPYHNNTLFSTGLSSPITTSDMPLFRNKSMFSSCGQRGTINATQVFVYEDRVEADASKLQAKLDIVRDVISTRARSSKPGNKQPLVPPRQVPILYKALNNQS